MRGKRTIAVLLILLLALSLFTGCFSVIRPEPTDPPATRRPRSTKAPATEEPDTGGFGGLSGLFGSPEDRYLGLYRLSTYRVYGEGYTVQELAELMELDADEARDLVTLDLRSDGRGTYCFNGETREVTWKAEGDTITLTADGEKLEGTIKDGVIILNLEDEVVELLRKDLEEPFYAPPAPPTAAPAVPTPTESPYHFAEHYATDAEGWPLEKWVYDRPLCDNDEVFTRWTTCYTPFYLPEGGFNGIETWQEVAEWTGVHIEYNVVDSANRRENFSVLIASDDLADITDQGMYFYTGSVEQCIEEGYFADLWDRRNLMPCFMYEIHNRSLTNPECLNTLFYKKSHLITLYGLVMDPVPTMGYVVRQDWMDTLGLGSSRDIETWDQMHDVMTAFKVNMSNNRYGNGELFPFFIYSVGESTPGYNFTGYDTVLYMSSCSYTRVKNGRVELCGTTDDDKALMTMLHQWYDEGLINPNFQSYVIGSDYDAGSWKDRVGAQPQTPGAVAQDEASSVDPNTRWEPVHRTKRYAGQELNYGNRISETHYGSANLSAKCKNLDLLCAYMDWWMSDWGGEWTSWGPEGSSKNAVGYCWFYNAQGERQLTDWVMNNDIGPIWIMLIYCNNNLVEFCLHDISRSYHYPGGEREWGFYQVWKIPGYRGLYDWPTGIVFSDEQTQKLSNLRTDMTTYFTENYVSFLTGVKPLSEWDSFISDMKSFGMDELLEIYQAAYDRYMAEQ